ncbi:MAG: GNAT family N-acetyltransferase [Nitrosopumilus sp. B06]|nr:MAG: GNAT family N-acetyltransferase [Nitrosopumilus sp. D6]RNJ79699.1 MAG: GNAT family N-acetyltransferase [Nitrosopumilus sp. B06]
MSARTASNRDIPVILGLLYDLGRPRPKEDKEVDIFRKMVKKYIADDDKQILVAALDEIKLVGMAAVMFLPRLNRTTTELYIPELIVSENYRGRGAGRMLIKECIRIANKKKCHRIRLESGNSRGESHKFYSDAGFEQSALSFTMSIK